MQVLDLGGRRRGREDVGHERARIRAVVAGILALAQRVEATIEFPFQAIDHQRVEAREALLIEQLVQPVLPFDEEVQAPLAVFDIEGEQILDPAGKVVRG